MFKNLLKGVVALGVLLMLNNPAQAFYTDMNESHWAYQSIKFLTGTSKISAIRKSFLRLMNSLPVSMQARCSRERSAISAS